MILYPHSLGDDWEHAKDWLYFCVLAIFGASLKRNSSTFALEGNGSEGARLRSAAPPAPSQCLEVRPVEARLGEVRPGEDRPGEDRPGEVRF